MGSWYGTSEVHFNTMELNVIEGRKNKVNNKLYTLFNCM